MSGSFSPRTATAIVVANMIGTGVFTSLGFQLLDIQSGFVLLLLWVVGGVIALCGALTYAELGAALPRSGGEYNFLSRIYHPAAGFVSGWVSATIGFAAPTALAAITFGTYLGSSIPGVDATPAAAALVLLVTAAHAATYATSSGFQLAFTAVKVVLIVVFCIVCVAAADGLQPVSFLPESGDLALIGAPAFAVALIYVNYAYTGWNAATYLSSELQAPQQHLPLILLTGTGAVLLIYLALNAVFLLVAPMASSMAGQLEIGYIVADAALGETGARVTGIMLALLLVSTVSAMILAGPRVLHAIGEDFPALSLLARTNRSGIPVAAILFQSTISLGLIFTASFEQILVFSGFTLALNTLLAVAGVFVLRWRQPDLERPYRAWGYPVTPLVYLALTGWTLTFILIERPVEGFAGLGIVVAGVLFYLLTSFLQALRERRTS